MPALMKKKSEFMTTVVPEWIAKAAEREAKMNQ
jgi:hypothetical protein